MMNDNVFEKRLLTVGELITAPGTQPGGIFIATVVNVGEIAVKVDFCWDSSNNRGLTVFNYTTWIPKGQITHDELGFLTVKKWWINNIKKEYVHRIKKYAIVDGKQIFYE